MILRVPSFFVDSTHIREEGNPRPEANSVATRKQQNQEGNNSIGRIGNGNQVLISLAGPGAWGLGNSPNRVGVQGPGLPGPLHGVGPQKGCHSIATACYEYLCRCVPRLSHLISLCLSGRAAAYNFVLASKVGMRMT